MKFVVVNNLVVSFDVFRHGFDTGPRHDGTLQIEVAAKKNTKKVELFDFSACILCEVWYSNLYTTILVELKTT